MNIMRSMLTCKVASLLRKWSSRVYSRNCMTKLQDRRVSLSSLALYIADMHVGSAGKSDHNIEFLLHSKMICLLYSPNTVVCLTHEF